jgi:hypothetical protein
MKTLILLSTFLIGNSLAANASRVCISLSNANSDCTTQLIFNDGAIAGFDKTDREMKEIPRNHLNYIYSMGEKGQKLFVNHCPKPSQYFSVSIQISIQQAGTFNLAIDDMENDLGGIDFSLTDVLSSETVKLTPGFTKELVFNEAEINSTKNFILHVFPAPVFSSTAVTCSGSKDGSIQVAFCEKGQWEVKLRNGVAQLAKNTNTTSASEFKDLGAGIYFVQIWKNNMMIDEEIVSVAHPPLPKAQFQISADTMFCGKTFFTTNLSDGGNHWYWEFGDNSVSNAYQPSHKYQTAGKYTVTLTTADATGCVSVSTKTIFVSGEKDGNVVISN